MRKLKFLTIVPFETEHLKKLKLRPEEAYMEQMDRDELARQLSQKGPAYSVFYKDKSKDKLLVCAGIVILWPSVGEAWSFCDVEVRRFSREIYVYISSSLNELIKQYNLHRIQAHALTIWRSAYRFLERLGFEREGIMKRYGINGEDYYLYARVIEWQDQLQ